MLPHAVVHVGSYAYVELCFPLDDVNEPVSHGILTKLCAYDLGQFSNVDLTWGNGTDFLRPPSGRAQDKLTGGSRHGPEGARIKGAAKAPLILAPRDGLEPPTKWLTATRSTS